MPQDKKPAGPSWVRSEHNFSDEIPQPRHTVTLHDLTIRDGEESADLAFTTADKLKIADALARLGIKRTEVFLTVPGWHEVVRGIMAANLGLDLWVTWMRGKVEKALDLGVRHVMIWHGAGEGPQKYIAKQSRPQLIDQLAAKIDTAKAAGCKVNVFMPESTRSDVAHLLDVARMAEEHGADAITIVDSQGVMRPAAMTWLVRQIKQATKLEVEVHCHNDFGLAVANVLAGYEGGADILQVSINGIGYRAGNASMESVAMALEVLYGVPTGLQLDRLPEVCALVQRLSGIPANYYQPIVGKGAFRYEQWMRHRHLQRGRRAPLGLPVRAGTGRSQAGAGDRQVERRWRGDPEARRIRPHRHAGAGEPDPHRQPTRRRGHPPAARRPGVPRHRARSRCQRERPVGMWRTVLKIPVHHVRQANSTHSG